MRRVFVLALLLSGCGASPAPEPLILPPDPPPVQQAQRAQPKAPPVAAPSTITTLTASEIVVAADQARVDATGYVAWKHSKAENIDRLTTLTTNLTAAVSQMQAGRVRGKYKPTDVVAARGALRELRSFLANKGD